MKKIFFTDKVPAPIGPYSQAILNGKNTWVPYRVIGN